LTLPLNPKYRYEIFLPSGGETILSAEDLCARLSSDAK